MPPAVFTAVHSGIPGGQQHFVAGADSADMDRLMSSLTPLLV